jgi:2-polyprenyl-3-methyl-5-hydroxy-6-metoxy-1,4-benzoquinol methylase
MIEPREGEEQYRELISDARARGPEQMGFMTSWAWRDDPRRMAFMFSRYKFVSKMIAGVDHAVEIGCGDGFASRIVAQSVKRLTAVDFDPEFIESALSNRGEHFPIEFFRHDMLLGPVPGSYDAFYSLDVLEHIQPADEDAFLRNAAACLKPHGIGVIGTPSLESQLYASKFSKMGHVNCKTQEDLRASMLKVFRNVFMFSMNDEVVHTGYGRMSHYNIALCCSPIPQSAAA